MLCCGGQKGLQTSAPDVCFTRYTGFAQWTCAIFIKSVSRDAKCTHAYHVMTSYSVSFMSKHPHSPGGILSHLKTATGHITPRAKQELYQKLYRKKKMYFQSGSERVHWLSWPALLRASGTLTANTRFHLFSAELMKYRLQKKQKQNLHPRTSVIHWHV